MKWNAADAGSKGDYAACSINNHITGASDRNACSVQQQA